MKVIHLSADASPEDVNAILERDACVVIDELATKEQVDAVVAEMAPYIEATDFGRDDFTGSFTRRTGAIIARSLSARALISHPLILASVEKHLVGASNFHLHLTQMISISGGEPEQTIHRDQWAFDSFPFPGGFEVQFNTIWAMSDFTEENGATRVIPGSGKWKDKLKLGSEQAVAAEMKKGSVLLYNGSLYHGGGANHSEEVRMGLNITYARAFLTQEENQFLSVPKEIAKTLPEPLLRLMGYAPAAYALNYVGDVQDPLLSVLPGHRDKGAVLGVFPKQLDTRSEKPSKI